MRHDCAHCPRFAERPPHASLVRHCPLHDTQSAPCTKTSSSRSVSLASAPISSTESSRGTTKRVAPSPFANAAPPALVIVICVLACTSSAGQSVRASSATAGSCTMIASTPASATPRTMRATSASSGSNTSVLSVTYALVPARWICATVARRSASAKFFARARALKPSSRPK